MTANSTAKNLAPGNTNPSHSGLPERDQQQPPVSGQCSDPAYGPDQRGHDLMQGLALLQAGTDEQAQAPQALRLDSPTLIRWVALKIALEYSLKPSVKVRVMLGCTQ